MSGKRRFCYHCSEYVSKSTYFEHQKELIGRKSNDDSLQLQDDEHTDDFDSSNDEPECISDLDRTRGSSHESDCSTGTSESEQERVDTLAKDFDEFKKQVTTKLTPPSAAAGQDRQSSGQRIPSELSVQKSSHNQAVATWLMDQLKKTTKLEKHSEFYSRAVYRYYESRRRQFNDSLQSREEAVHANHKNSRKRRSQKKLYQDRQSVLKEKEQKKWGEIDPSFMTDESDYEQAGKKVKVTHKPAWRSNLLNRMIAKLDQRLAANEKKSDYVGFKRRERVAGLLSVSEPPSTAPAWAVGDGSEHDHDKSMGLDVQTDGISLAEHSARSLDKDVS
ncbi:hypothetical protein EMCRGX_G005387 [Ephydatia muelleri]